MAAALARRLGRVGRRLRSKLHGTDRQQPRGAHAKRQIVEKKEAAAAMKATATGPPMVAVLAAVPAMFRCSESNIWEQ